MHPGIVVGRGLAKFLVGGSVTRVTVKAIKANVPAPENKRETIRLAVASYAISGMVADQATQWIGKEIDELVEWFEERKKKPEEKDTPEQPAEVVADAPVEG